MIIIEFRKVQVSVTSQNTFLVVAYNSDVFILVTFCFDERHLRDRNYKLVGVEMCTTTISFAD